MSNTEENKNNFSTGQTGDYSDNWGFSDGSVNQAMQQYLRELGQIPRLTPEEQDSLKKQILAAENKWRNILYGFAFIARFQREHLLNKDIPQWREQFIPSAWTDGVTVEVLKDFLEKLNLLEQQLHTAFQQKNAEETEQLRNELAAEQNKYKFTCDVLFTGYKQLLTALEPDSENLLKVFAEEACYTVQEFKNKLNEV
ncbi:MAG: hypothetical protein J6Q81_04850, partial [Lentisphaeria bacterium]|nr:hypothetical protein [Lentisphaeria bacterium]